MSERDCNTCKHWYGKDGCEVWNCKYEKRSDLISRQDAIEAINNRLQDPADFGNGEYRSGLYACEEILKELPSVDITDTEQCQKCQETTDRVLINQARRIKALESAEKTGKWILAKDQSKEDTENGNYRYVCSECEYSDIHAKTQEVPYCWHCGARMVNEDESNL